MKRTTITLAALLLAFVAGAFSPRLTMLNADLQDRLNDFPDTASIIVRVDNQDYGVASVELETDKVVIYAD